MLFVQTAFAQIEMFDESVKKVEMPKALPYDSLRNMATQKFGSGDNYKYTFDHLIGQTLLYCGDPYVAGYSNRSGFKIGSYYKVTGTLPDNTGKGLYCRMTLVDTETGETKEEGDLTSSKYNMRWVVVGHYEKMKSLYIDKEFVFLGFDNYCSTYGYKSDGFINLETDTVTRNIPETSVWKCTNVQVKPRKRDDRMDHEKRSPIVLVFDNPDYGKHYCYLEDGSGKPYKSLSDNKQSLVCGRFQLKADYDREKAQNAAAKAKRKADLTKKYGAANANMILNETVKIGMTKEMCKEAWGEPYDINRSSGSWGTHEQWVYGSSYLYFEGNKLTAIQN